MYIRDDVDARESELINSRLYVLKEDMYIKIPLSMEEIHEDKILPQIESKIPKYVVDTWKEEGFKYQNHCTQIDIDRVVTAFKESQKTDNVKELEAMFD